MKKKNEEKKKRLNAWRFCAATGERIDPGAGFECVAGVDVDDAAIAPDGDGAVGLFTLGARAYAEGNVPSAYADARRLVFKEWA